MPRTYERKFDWDEARELFAAGVGRPEIAARFGVTYEAIYRITAPGALERQRAYNREWQTRGVCADCGGRMNRSAQSAGSTRCKPCANLALATTVRPTELQRCSCREWKPDDAFPNNRSEGAARRGRHSQCRRCQTIARREHRQRNREAANAYDREYKRRRRAAAA